MNQKNTLIFKSKDYSLKRFRYFECESCKSIFLNPIPSDKEIYKFYTDPEYADEIIDEPNVLREKYLNEDSVNRDFEQHIVPLKNMLRMKIS